MEPSGRDEAAELSDERALPLRPPLTRAGSAVAAFLEGAPDYRRVRNVYLRGLGLVFLFAFGSWYVQQDGLIGSQGILPAAEYLSRARDSLGARAFLEIPTLLWFGSSDLALAAVAIAGMVASLLLLAGVLPLLSLLACWALYLSLSVVGGLFMHYQWDALLLEAGLTSLLLCPLGLRLRRDGPGPHPVALLLVRWLLFRVVFLSAWVKIASGDPTWRGLTALDYHYWTQPLPTWTAWFMNASPRAIHALSTLVMFAIELGAPVFIFLPRRLRLPLAFNLLVFLQVVILLTGNFGFFNVLTLVLCIPLLDDQALARIKLRWTGRFKGAPPPPRSSAAASAGRVLAGIAGFLFFMTVSVGEIGTGVLGADLPPWQEKLLDAVRPFRSINTYGLFATMTTERLEIGLEGSDDGHTWRPYRFRWKPGDPSQRPRFATPHMPRLDWQMWFAALGDCRRNQWFVLLQQRLFEGKKPVAALFAEDPFPDHPPRYLRSPLYRYRFTDWPHLRRDGLWWTRFPAGEFCPRVSFEGGQLHKVTSR